MQPSPAGTRQVVKTVGPSKILNQDCSLSMMTNNLNKSIFNKIKSTRLGFGQFGGRLPGISGLMKRPKHESQASTTTVQRKDSNASKGPGISPIGCSNQVETVASALNRDNTLTPLSLNQTEVPSVVIIAVP